MRKLSKTFRTPWRRIQHWHAAYALQGQILSVQGNRDEALMSFDQALNLDPSNEAARSGKNALMTSPKQP